MSKNQSQPLNQLVGTLNQALSMRAKAKNAPKRPKKTNRAKGLSRNQGSRPGGTGLALTRTQFTATSPLNLFTVRTGSTPGGVRVSGRELINSVTLAAATGVFQVSTAFPGTTGTSSIIAPSVFPRLNAYVPIYEYFIFHKLDYLFQSNQPTTQAGEIILSVDYDPTDSAPTNVSAMMRNVSSTMANIYSDASLQVLESLSRLKRYETSAASSETLQQLQGMLTVAVQGYVNASASTVGYIIAQYDVEFFTPQ